MLISILIPCYNASKWISHAIYSLSHQTHKDLEILIFNDGSTDKSFEICSTIAKNDTRIKLVNSNENFGIVQALNNLSQIAQGDLIGRMDADDIAHPQRLERQLHWINTQEVDMCGSWFTEFGQGIPRTTKWPTSNKELKTAMLFQNSICHPTILAKRKIFEEFNYSEQYRYVEDYDFFSRIMTEYKVCNLPQSLLRYRRHPNQETQLRMDRMEIGNTKIRLENLVRSGISPNPEELDAHNKIRSKTSITHLDDLQRIEHWLLKLINLTSDESSKRIIASQWVRACIRSAPLGRDMWDAYRSSEIQRLIGGMGKDIDIYLLSITKLNYNSRVFNTLKRLGISA